MSPSAQIVAIIAYHVALVAVAWSMAGMWKSDHDDHDHY